MDGQSVRNAWRLWHFEWKLPRNGNYNLVARASDASGRVQPNARNGDYGSYVINYWLPVEVEVR